MPRSRRRSEVERLEAELEAVRPYLPLAQEIRDDVARLASDDAVDAHGLVQLIDSIPERERATVLRSVFDRLPVETQWEVLAEAYGDDAIRTALADEHAAVIEALDRTAAVRQIVQRARRERRVDLRELPPLSSVTLGLYVEQDVPSATPLGARSARCAREIVLQSTDEPGTCRVVRDAFNPRGGYFVTAAYDQGSWAAERLPSHALVRAGAISGPGAFEPVLGLGARVDFDVDGVPAEGHLHLGHVMVGDEDVFGEGGRTS